MKGNDYWYLSPLRNEKSPSFKVNRTKNLWYDHGIGKGGTLVDFGILYYRCSVKEFLAKLEDEKGPIFLFTRKIKSRLVKGKKPEKGGGKTKYLTIAKSLISVFGNTCKPVKFH